MARFRIIVECDQPRSFADIIEYAKKQTGSKVDFDLIEGRPNRHAMPKSKAARTEPTDIETVTKRSTDRPRRPPQRRAGRSEAIEAFIKRQASAPFHRTDLMRHLTMRGFSSKGVDTRLSVLTSKKRLKRLGEGRYAALRTA